MTQDSSFPLTPPSHPPIPPPLQIIAIASEFGFEIHELSEGMKEMLGILLPGGISVCLIAESQLSRMMVLL